MDQLDDVDSVRVLRPAQTQVLNNDLVVSSPDQPFRFLKLARSVDCKTMLGEVLTHGKTDRLFVIDDEELCRVWFCAIRNCRLFPAAEELA